MKLVILTLIGIVTAAPARADSELPRPLGVRDVVSLARSRRAEIVAAEARARAAGQRRDDIVPRAEQAIAPTLAAYSAGQIPLVGVIEVAQALWSAQLDLVMARAELGIAWARLRRASNEEVTP